MRRSRACGAMVLLSAMTLCGSPGRAQALTAADSCAQIAGLKLGGTRITRAEAISSQTDYVVPETVLNPPQRGGPTLVTRPFCRVAGIIESRIRFEVWMPLDKWNGRFEGVGNGAFSGAVPYAQLAGALSRDYAVGGTDMGHQSDFTDAAWALASDGRLNIQAVADWAFRSVHAMTVASQAIVRAMYGKSARRSYFAGCSSGGHQALTEAQRYPNDYDGILAGAPANYWTHLMAGQLWYGLATRIDPATNLEEPDDQLKLVHAAVLQACDAADGVRDGVVENPLACKFDLQPMECKSGDAKACLTAPQLAALRKIYGNAQSDEGVKIFPGLAPGGELGWTSMSAAQVPFAQTFYRYLVFQKPGWNYASMHFAQDVAYADRRVGGIVNSINPDLRAFRARGGKLLQYHGWNDPLISPYNSIDYYEAVLAKLGRGAPRDAALVNVQTFHRLFMVPGMNHCRGGDGADSFDALDALTRWVELAEAPERLEAAKRVDGKIVRTRPLCPYPKIAHYRGTGSIDESVNFECEAP